MLNLKNTLDGYLKNVEVIGNTIQDENNLADIRSVGDKVEGQELYKIPVVSCGKNLFKMCKDNEIHRNSYNGIIEIQHNGFSLTDTCNGDMAGFVMKCKPNTEYVVTFNDVSSTKVQKFFRAYTEYPIDSNANYNINVGTANGSSIKLTTTSNCNYIFFGVYGSNGTSTIKDIQVEEGTQATSYEPYQEQKLEILSPVQLEKVGNVVDRIICKDGVWGVEKNVITYHLKDFTQSNYNGFACRTILPTLGIALNNHTTIPFYTNIDYKHTDINFQWNNRKINSIAVSKTTINGQYGYVCDITSENYVFNDMIKLIQDNDIWVKYALLEPQFIPLPHDQQVKLRTFAGQTNIAFLTEIPGQIKAQVPKSLGATVNTHTEQIADLHNSLDRVKKLEETTVSTIETVSNFTTVDATSNGYFEDVKLEGKTLVNKSRIKSKHIISSGDRLCNVFLGQNLSQFTLIVDVSNLNGTLKSYGIYADNNQDIYTQTTDVNGKWITYFNLNRPIKEFTLYVDGGTNHEAILDNIVVLEGDHTNNPLSYFEGLMSVGQDVEEVSVESVNENLFNVAKHNTLRQVNDYIETTSHANHFIEYSLLPNTDYTLSFDKYSNDPCWVAVAVEGYGFANNNNTNFYKTYRTDINGILRVSIRANGADDIGHKIKNIMLTHSATPKSYTPRQSNKKPLLYYNPNNETWERPILREWDTIEKHSDGKYYYHKRSGEVVLNGSENFKLNGNFNAIFGNTETVAFSYTIQGYLKSPTPNTILCDIFRTDLSRTDDIDGIYNFDAYAGFNTIVFKILKGKLSTQDVAGFKQWLKANPTTVVYQLEQEEVYECTNIDLMTYSGETNYIINSGAISPKSLLKVHNNISNVVKILQEKVSLLENTFIAGLKSVLSGDMYSLATILYPEDFEQNDNTEQDIMVIPE